MKLCCIPCALWLAAGCLLGVEAAPAADTAAALAAAQARLAELRRVCKDAHPLVQAELRRIAELEHQRRLAGDPRAALTLARERLAELRKTCKDAHPQVRAQQLLIANLERHLPPPSGQP